MKPSKTNKVYNLSGVDITLYLGGDGVLFRLTVGDDEKLGDEVLDAADGDLDELMPILAEAVKAWKKGKRA